MSTITLLQRINPSFQAVLARVEHKTPILDQSWDTKFDDPLRADYHRKKMMSKDLRPAKQLLALGVEPGTVLHEVLR
jgi:hypothetical protein